MKNALGCVVSLLCFGALAAVYWYYLSPRIEWPGDAFMTGLGSLFAAMFLSSIWGVLRAYRDAARLARASTQSVGQLRDGETIAVTGTIRPLGFPLQSPVTGTNCVAYDYDVYHRARRQ